MPSRRQRCGAPTFASVSRASWPCISGHPVRQHASPPIPPASLLSDVAPALVTPCETTGTERKRLDNRMPALAVVGSTVPPLRFAAPHVAALRADPEIERAPALLAGSTEAGLPDLPHAHSRPCPSRTFPR